jgi:hypothetical protein
MLPKVTELICYLKSRILTDMHRVLCFFLRGLFNDASESQNMQRRTIGLLMNNEMERIWKDSVMA